MDPKHRLKYGQGLSASHNLHAGLGVRAGYVLAQTVAPFVAQRDRWALFAPVPMAAGIAGWFALPAQPDWWLAGFFVVTALAIWRVLSASDGWRLPALILVWVTLGFAASEWRAYRVDAPVLEKPLRFAKLEASVDSVHPRRGAHQVILSNLLISGMPAEKTPGRIRLTVRGKKLEWMPGDRVRLQARLFPPSRPVMPGAWDYGRQLWFDEINATGFSFGQGELVRRYGPGDVAAYIATWRQELSGRLLDAFTRQGRDGGLALALITGERGLLPDAIRSDMRSAGLAHLLAISGLHIGLVSGMVYMVIRAFLALVPPIALHWPIHKIAAVIAWSTALFYWQLAGATIPTERAFIMVSVFFLAILLDRQALSMRNVMIAGLVLLTFRPEAVMNAGFHLSFAATAALVAAVEIWRNRRSRYRRDDGVILRLVKRVAAYPLAVITTSLIAGMATAPLAAWHFGQMAHYGLLGNLLAIPLIGLVVMPAGILLVLSLPFALTDLPVRVMSEGLGLVEGIAHWVASLPGATGLVPAQAPQAILLYGLGLLLFVGWRGRLRLLALPVFVLAFAALVFQAPAKPALIIGEDGKMVLLQTRPPSYWSDGKADSWLLSRWGQAYGVSPDSYADLTKNEVPGSWSCDHWGCSGIMQDYRIAIARHASAIALDCQKADILIAMVPVRQSCNGPVTIIDRFDLWRLGSHAITLSPVLTVKTVIDPNRNRPWRPRRSKGKSDRKTGVEDQ